MIMERPWDEEGDVDSMWGEMGTCIRKVAREVIGVAPKCKKLEGLSRRRRSATRVGTTI
jgi:hypothetical protein